jgi:CheY-like chemotaxis protein
MRILLVDEDSAFRSELGALVEEAGHSVTGVASAAKATDLLDREEFEVMFTDLHTGRVSGLELLRLAKKRWPRLLVVMLTGQATVESAVQALHVGAFDYIRKPVSASQVHRVLDLVGQQLALIRVGAKPLDPAQYASSLATEGGYEVLLISPPPVHLETERVSHLPLDAENPARIRDAVEGFVAPREKPAVVLAAIERLLAIHREEDVAALLEGIRALLDGKGILAVGYDPDTITATGALAVRASIVAADAHQTLESLANPIRRMILRRLGEGPCGFSEAMKAAHVDDTSLISFHLRKLTENGLVAHLPRENYQLSPRGKGALTVLNSIYNLESAKGNGNRVFPTKSPKGGPGHSPRT